MDALVRKWAHRRSDPTIFDVLTQSMRIFENHGMVNVGYWVPQDAPASSNTLMNVSWVMSSAVAWLPVRRSARAWIARAWRR